MKTFFMMLALVAMVVMGCATTQNTAGKLLASTAVTVDGAMKGWAIWVNDGKANQGQQNNVRKAYERYQGAMQVARAAYLAMGKTPEVWAPAADGLVASQTDLTGRIAEFKKEGK